MKKLQKLSNLLPVFSTRTAAYFAFILFAFLPLFAGNILLDSHSYVFGVHINYLHLRITLHFLLSATYLLYESRKYTWKEITSNTLIRWTVIGTFFLCLYTGIRSYIIASTYTSQPLVYAVISSIKLGSWIIMSGAFVIALKRIFNATKEQYHGSFLIGVSILFQLLLSLLQVQIRGPVYPKFMSWSGQPVTFTSFSYVYTTIIERAYGTTPHPNILGGVMAITLLVVLSLQIPKFVKAMLAIGCFAIIYLTMSRAALATGIIIIGIYVTKRFLQHKPLLQLFTTRYTSLLYFFVNGLLYLGFFYSLRFEYTKTFIDSRSHIQSLYFELLTKNPSIALLGTGFTQAIPALLAKRLHFETSIYYLNRLLSEPPHNALLLTIVEFGIPLAFGLWIVLFSLLWKAFNSQPTWIKLSLFVLLLILGGVDHYIIY